MTLLNHRRLAYEASLDELIDRTHEGYPVQIPLNYGDPAHTYYRGKKLKRLLKEKK